MQGYEEDYHSELHKNLSSDSEYYQVRARLALKKYFSGIPKDAKILEFGCGMGQNLVFFPNAIGHDISKFALDFCNKKGIKTFDNLNKIKDGSIDVIFSSHVLEHVENPLETLKSIHKKLKNNGKFILIIPEQKLDKPKIKPDINQHLYCWTFTTINNLLFKAGFKPVENKYLIWNTGCKKFLPMSRISFKFYEFLTKFASIITRRSLEMKIVSIKL